MNPTAHSNILNHHTDRKNIFINVKTKKKTHRTIKNSNDKQKKRNKQTRKQQKAEKKKKHKMALT